MENSFALAKNSRSIDAESFKVEHALQVVHGEQGIKRGISDVLNTIVPHYNYTNFEELNAVLRLYNVAAHRGEEGSRLHKLGGLLYYALNEKGERISLPIKASSFLLKPTLANLEARYVSNLALRGEELRSHIDTYVEWTLRVKKPTWERFREAMEKEGISVVVMPDKKGGIDAVYFVHHGQKCVFAGESLGPEYGLRALKERCSLEERQEEQQRQRLRLRL